MSFNVDPAELTDRVKREARRLGFDLVGVTDPEPPPHLDVFERWLEASRHGEMAYLSTERSLTRRADPRSILPECESILIVGANCLPGLIQDQSAAVRVAAYARGEDYHAVLVERLRRLVAFIQEQTGLKDLPNRIYTDTGPLLERELAQRAGLGWIGKNTCLINPTLGSHFLLAEVMLAIRLVPDSPFPADRCGSCTRCIAACPTECILPDRTLDATRCISSLTIELKGAIPPELRSSVGNWVFGCDVCQEVCPWNVRFSRPTRDPAFQPTPALANPRPQDFLDLHPTGWRARLRGTALLRARRTGLVRNASVVAGNRASQEMVQPLAAVLGGDPDPVVRAHAAWGLGRIGGSGARNALLEAQTSEQDPEALKEIATALRGLEDAVNTNAQSA